MGEDFPLMTSPQNSPVIEPWVAPPQVLRIAEELQKQDEFSTWCPTDGSKDHAAGTCRPCAFLYTRGCANGKTCQFCHVCPPGEKKRRQREKFQNLKKERLPADMSEHAEAQAGSMDKCDSTAIPIKDDKSIDNGAAAVSRSPVKTGGRW